MTAITNDVLLDVENLRTFITSRRGTVRAVNGVSFSLGRGEVLGLVGESGSGKSLTCFSVVRVLPPGGQIVSGNVMFKGRDLTKLSEADLRDVRGPGIGMILQDPLASLDPLMRTGDQVAETLRAHRRITATRRDERRSTLPDGSPAEEKLSTNNRVLELFRLLRIPDAERRVRSYPHQMSGGMKQRVVGAVALAAEPELLIADEPTTALDVTVQAQILRLLKELQERRQMSMILVTHDLAVAAEVCDRIAVMYGGRIVEIGPTATIFGDPQHQYTRGLLRSLPRMGDERTRLVPIEGQPPDARALPPGCAFVDRCPVALPRCRDEFPPATQASAIHTFHCWNPGSGARPAMRSNGVTENE